MKINGDISLLNFFGTFPNVMVGGTSVDMCQGGEGRQQILWYLHHHGKKKWRRRRIDSNKKHKQCAGKGADDEAKGASMCMA